MVGQARVRVGLRFQIVVLRDAVNWSRFYDFQNDSKIVDNDLR